MGGGEAWSSLPVGHHQHLPDHLAHPLDVPTDSREGRFLAQAHTEGHQNPELLPPSLELSRPLPGSEATISGEALLVKLSGVGFVPLLPDYRGLPCATIPKTGVLAIIHFLPNEMLASDEELWGRQGMLTVNPSPGSFTIPL